MSTLNNFLIAWNLKKPPPPPPPPAPAEIAAQSWVENQRQLLAAKLRAEEANAEVDMLNKRVARLATDMHTLMDPV